MQYYFLKHFCDMLTNLEHLCKTCLGCLECCWINGLLNVLLLNISMMLKENHSGTFSKQGFRLYYVIYKIFWQCYMMINEEYAQCNILYPGCWCLRSQNIFLLNVSLMRSVNKGRMFCLWHSEDILWTMFSYL